MQKTKRLLKTLLLLSLISCRAPELKNPITICFPQITTTDGPVCFCGDYEVTKENAGVVGEVYEREYEACIENVATIPLDDDVVRLLDFHEEYSLFLRELESR